MEKSYFNEDERALARALAARVMRVLAPTLRADDLRATRSLITSAIAAGHYARDRFGINPLLHNLQTAAILCDMISPDRNMVIAIMLYNLVRDSDASVDELSARWGSDVAKLLTGLGKVASLYSKQAAMESDNFRKLLLTFAQDIRVIIIMICDRLALMRAINHHPNAKLVHDVAYEANYLYAPLAHRLGLYAIKQELEDLSLKYTSRDTYRDIADKLKATKAVRDAYIDAFIAPIRERLEREPLRFELKGRTKSIYSIWNKMRKQKKDVDDIYDLFAIRIILDSEPEREKADCWLVYSIITDLYQPNPARMKDWISIPKSNGYESLHVTVHGPDGRWVEVQIRTRRMDEIAEKGLAAHWKYKGIKAEKDLDRWMANVRDILETAETGPMELMKDFKMDVYDKEVFVFTPRGDLYKLPMGASVLDFAFHIHTSLGCRCTGGKVNGRNQKINYRLHSGDTVEILTASTQKPKTDWLNFCVTSKARNKIRVVIKEQESRDAEIGKELLQRRFKNRKIDIDESSLMKVVKKLGFKSATDFYDSLARELTDINTVIEAYLDIERSANSAAEKVSADEYVMPTETETDAGADSGDVLVIDNSDIKGLNYRFARCCNPVYGDDVFGFVSAEGLIKIHRTDCPNACHIHEKYPYRIIATRWSGKVGGQRAVTLSVVGRDDIGIVTNITSIINKTKNATLRNISIDSHDGIFNGFLIVGIQDSDTLASLILKLKTVKGVKDVQRAS